MSEHPPGSDDMIELRDDGTGKPCSMRIPCQRFHQIMRDHPTLDVWYRLRNPVREGHEVFFAMPVDIKGKNPAGTKPRLKIIKESVNRGIATRRNGGYVEIAVELIEEATLTVIDIERLENEVWLVSDTEFMEKYER